MKVLFGIRRMRRLKRPVAAVGVFDGIHRGHMAVLEAARRRAREIGGTACVVTFDPHPVKVLYPGRGLPRITSLEHRLRLMERAGMDAAFVIRFSRKFAKRSPAEFVDKVLVSRIGVHELVIGENFHFGEGRTGGIDILKRLADERGFRIRIIRAVKSHNAVVSSTRVRQLIVSGRLSGASGLLGRNVSILGTVISGSGRGRRIGYPTANIDPHHEAIPPDGVYAVRVSIDGDRRKGVVNIGMRPTFGGGTKGRGRTIEAHILDYGGMLYGKTVELEFSRRIRGERYFPSVGLLKKRIAKDIAAARKIL